MKQALTTITVLVAVSFTAAIVWAGGMGGGMMGGDTGGMSHLMDSYENHLMWPGQSMGGYYDDQRVREVYDHYMRQLNRVVGPKEGILDAEMQKKETGQGENRVAAPGNVRIGTSL